jgi:hypothetical protein
MKKVKTSALVALLIICASSPAVLAQDGGSGVVVPLPRDGYRYKLTLRNDGVKTIKSIDWDYLFLDPTTQQEIARHQFTSDETIKPGKNKEISVLYLIPPVKLVSARMLNKKDLPFTQQVVVARIQYSDGSSWQHP